MFRILVILKSLLNSFQASITTLEEWSMENLTVQLDISAYSQASKTGDLVQLELTQARMTLVTLYGLVNLVPSPITVL